MMEFKSGWNTGFHMTFENGLTASVQWGHGTFTDNRRKDSSDDNSTSTTAEVAVISEERKLLDIDSFLPKDCHTDYLDDTVCGYLSPDEVVEFLIRVKNYEV